MEGEIKLGSLFSGSGGFELAGSLSGITPVWNSEIEPFPILVTSKRFPKVKHLGDVSSINGAEIEPVDVITFGSPCQDLSVAGKRAGMKHTDNGDEETTRSGLFMEAVRIIKEMRCKTNGRYPTFAVWENVPGAFSSNKGEDFRTVLEELAKIKEAGISIPKSAKWLLAGEIVGEGYSIAWRTLDAQYWGVPQRRRRIYLVADFRGQCAGKILFERTGLRGDTAESGTQGQGTAGNAEDGTNAADRAVVYDGANVTSPINKQNPQPGDPCHTLSTDCRNYLCYDVRFSSEGTKNWRGHCYKTDVSRALDTDGGHPDSNHGRIAVIEPKCYAIENHPADSRVNIDESGKIQTLTSRMGTGGGNVPMVMEQPLCMATQQGGAEIYENLCPTITAAAGMSGNNQPVICLQGNGIDRADTAGCNGKGWNDKTCYTLNTIDRPAVAFALDSLASNSMKSKNPNSGCRVVDKAKTLDTSDQNPCKNQGINAQYDISIQENLMQTCVAKGPSAVCYGIGNRQANQAGLNREKVGCLNCMHDQQAVLIDEEPQYIVRRLTPLECCRLQGFTDCWTAGLETENPTEEDLIFWREVFETHRKIVTGASKPKTDKQIIKWLQNPYSDSAEYKMRGNGIALPNALFVMQGIAEELKEQEK